MTLISENQYSVFHAFAYSPIGSSLLDTSCRFLEVNQAFCDLLGYKKEELVTMSWKGISLQSEQENNVTAIERIGNGELASFQEEKELLHKAGHTVCPLVTASCIKEEGRTVAILVQVMEISAQERKDETLQYFESLYHFSSEGIGIFDLNGNVLDANKAFETIFGYSIEEIKGKMFPATPEFSVKDASYLLDAARKGTNVEGFQTVHQRKDGKFITTSITVTPIRKKSGKVYAFAGIIRDITEQEAAFAQIESFIDNNIDPILLFDAENRIIRVNLAVQTKLGWEPEDLLGVHLDSSPIVPEDQRLEVSRNTENVKANKTVKSVETVRLRKDGSSIDVLLTTFAIKDNRDIVTGVAVVLKDITEIKRAEEIVRNSEKLNIVGELAASLAHEIRNPITAIKGFLQIIEEESKKFDYFSIIYSEMHRIEIILNELLLLAKPQHVSFERKNLNVSLEYSIALLQAQANMNGIEILCDYPSTEVHIECEENQIKQVFINMIKNAIDAMPNGGRLTIQLRECQEEKNIFIRFQDEGIGIPKHIIEKLGEPFYTTKEKGTGLGFMVSKQIIEKHQGDITIESEVNRGTIIEIILPAEPSR